MKDMPELRTEDIADQEIFATGRWNNDEYGEADLDAMVDAHGKVGFRPPLKLGHSETQKLLKGEELPAAGWVENLRRVGDKLMADFKAVPKTIADLIRAGGYRKKSAEVYWEYLDEKQGTKLPRVLKAVALLGESIPAVTSLKDVVALYKRLPSGPDHAYEENGKEFRIYHMDCAMPVQSGMSLADFLVNFPRKSKENVDYREGDEDEKCGACKFFLGYPQACVLVEGRIEPEYVCDYFEGRAELKMMGGNGKVKKYTIEERDGEFCLIAKSTGKTLGCHPTREKAEAQERAVQANKHTDEQAIAVYQDDPDRICGNLWFNGTEEQRESHGDGTEGRGRDEKPPKAWWDDCVASIGTKKEEAVMAAKVYMSREEVQRICPPCAEKMREKNISALTFTAAQMAKFAEADMEKCMAKADMVEKYPDEADRKTACQKAMGGAMMEAIQEAKGGPDMDEKKFEELLEAKETEIKRDYDAKLADAKKREDEQAAKIKTLERQRYDDQNEAWIKEQKSAEKGRLMPVEESRIRAIFSSLFEDTRVVKFSHDGKEETETLMQSIKAFVEKRPNVYKEASVPGDDLPVETDSPGEEVNRRVVEYMNKNGVKDYGAAMHAVLKADTKLAADYLRMQKQ